MKFHGHMDVEKAYEWIQAQEMIHTSIVADADVRVELSTIHLVGAVGEWWQTTMAREGPT